MRTLFLFSRRSLAWAFGFTWLICGFGSASGTPALAPSPQQSAPGLALPPFRGEGTEGAPAQRASPPQVAIVIKIIELPEGSAENLELLGMLGVPNNAPVVDMPATSGKVLEPRPRIYPGRSTNPVGLTWTVSDSRLQAVLKAFERGNSVVISSPPRLTTSSGRKARIEVPNLPRATVPTTISWSQLRVAAPNYFLGLSVDSGELDPIIDLLPELQPDGYAIRMTVTPIIKEFVGYDLNPRTMLFDYEPSPINSGLNPSIETIPVAIRPQANGQNHAPSLPPLGPTRPMPIFRIRSVASSAVIRDGQTLALASLPANNVAIRPPESIPDQLVTAFRESERANSEIRSLLIFVTVRLVDASGKPVHADKELRSGEPALPAK